jgi:hypothetical protein
MSDKGLDIKYLSNLEELEKLHEEYAIKGLSTEQFKELKLDTYKRKNPKMSPGQINALWKVHNKAKEWKEKILRHWSPKYYEYVFGLNGLPETGNFRRMLDRKLKYVRERKQR